MNALIEEFQNAPNDGDSVSTVVKGLLYYIKYGREQQDPEIQKLIERLLNKRGKEVPK